MKTPEELTDAICEALGQKDNPARVIVELAIIEEFKNQYTKGVVDARDVALNTIGKLNK